MLDLRKTKRNSGSFVVNNGKLLLIRIGPANGQIQKHNSRRRDLVTGEKLDEAVVAGCVTPTRRGYWAFPFPFHDPFFYSHVWQRHMPKKFKQDSKGDWQDYSADEYEKVYSEIKKREKAKYIWLDKPFYSHIKPSYLQDNSKNWYYYTNAREWIEEAKKHLFSWHRYNGEAFKIHYSKDHLELFVPN